MQTRQTFSVVRSVILSLLLITAVFTLYAAAWGEEKTGKAKFFQAVEDGDIGTVKTLIQSGTDVNAQDKESGTALM